MNVNWTWLLIGMAVGYVVLPMATSSLRGMAAGSKS